MKEEIDELQEAVALQDPAKIEEEFGDLAFSLVNYARFLQLDAEGALEKANRKFISRFTRMEDEARLQGRSLADMTLAEMDGLWDAAKRLDAEGPGGVRRMGLAGRGEQRTKTNGLKSFFIDIFRRNIYLLLTAFGLFLGGYFLNLYFNSDAAVAGLRNSIQSFLQERERDFQQLTQDTALLTRLADRGDIPAY